MLYRFIRFTIETILVTLGAFGVLFVVIVMASQVQGQHEGIHGIIILPILTPLMLLLSFGAYALANACKLRCGFSRLVMSAVGVAIVTPPAATIVALGLQAAGVW
jgi:hypothetical protein